MAKITATVLATTLMMGVACGAMAQSMAPSSPGSSQSTPSYKAPTATDMQGTEGNSASSGKVATSTQVKSKLEASGYTRVQAIHKSADGWTATASKGGKSVHVAIDDHGNIETR